MTRRLTLPTDSDVRKRIPIRSGCIDYFPAALAGVAAHSIMGNDKHNPGQELHHARGKSMDHADCIDRHLTDIADFEAMLARKVTRELCADSDDIIANLLAEANALSWRSLALAQELHEKYGGAPLAPRARLPEPPRVVGMAPELAAPFGGITPLPQCIYQNGDGTSCPDAATPGGPCCVAHSRIPSI